MYKRQAKAEQELADAAQKIADGREDLEKLSEPEWYVLDLSLIHISGIITSILLRCRKIFLREKVVPLCPPAKPHPESPLKSGFFRR